MLEVRQPCRELAASFARMRDAFVAAGEDRWSAQTNHPAAALAHTDVDAYVALLADWARGKNLPQGWVPLDELWIVDGDVVVGQLGVRHRLTDWLRRIGGHIGFDVHPSHRNRGVATFALREGVRIVASRREPLALATCAEDNAASARVLEKGGGVRIADATVAGLTTRRRYVFAANLIATLATERLVLEPLAERHAEALFAVLSDPALWTFAGQREEEPAPQSVERLRELYRRFELRRTEDARQLLCSWAITLDGSPIGFVVAPFDPATQQAGLGYAVGSPWWNRGYATEAVRAASEHLAACGSRSIRATVDRANAASLRVLEKCGFACDDYGILVLRQRKGSV